MQEHLSGAHVNTPLIPETCRPTQMLCLPVVGILHLLQRPSEQHAIQHYLMQQS